METKITQGRPRQGTRDYGTLPLKRPETRHELPDEIAGRIHAIYFPFLKDSLTDKENDRILSATERIIKQVQNKECDTKIKDKL